MGSSEDADMKPPREFLYFFGGLFNFIFINYQKGGYEYG
jgi:hypothetical protein